MEHEIKSALLKRLGKNFITLFSALSTPFEFNLENVGAPFGIELFNNKKILNIEIKNDKSNYVYNVVTKLRSIEEFVETLKFDDIPLNIKQILTNKKFMPTIKENIDKKGYIIRTHFHGDVYLINKDNKMFLEDSNVKNTIINTKIVLQGIWYTDHNFGLLWSSNYIQIKKML